MFHYIIWRIRVCLQTEQKYMSEAARAATATFPSVVKNMFRQAVRTAATAAMAATSFYRRRRLKYPDRFQTCWKYKAGDGQEGGKKNCRGKDGDDIYIKVPEGTVIKEFYSGKVIADMSGDNRKVVLLKGGRGGNGNQHYATSTMQAPKYAQPGQPAQELELTLELKVIADVGLVGFPNVGKFHLLSRVSNARPKIANYHFTTLNPHLGVVDLPDMKSFVIRRHSGTDRGRFRRRRSRP